jgi:hypothetical protein
LKLAGFLLEATPGIEPGCADLQSAASPLRHVANLEAANYWIVPHPCQYPRHARGAWGSNAISFVTLVISTPVS